MSEINDNGNELMDIEDEFEDEVREELRQRLERRLQKRLEAREQNLDEIKRLKKKDP
jgi:hypothetical protein